MPNQIQQLVENYKIPTVAADLVKTTPIVLLVGVSGAGKDTIKRKLIETGKYHHIVSHTTRPPRQNLGVNEQEGVDYHFIDKQTAINMLINGEFIEAKLYGGNVYGTSVMEVQKAHDDHKVAIADVEIQGVAEYKAISDRVIAEFILPPDYDEWQKRLLSRYGSNDIDKADVDKRMKTAITELEEALDKPYYHFIINERVDEAVRAVDIIANNQDEFNTIDRSFQIWAEHLLEELRLRRS